MGRVRVESGGGEGEEGVEGGGGEGRDKNTCMLT